MTEMTGERARPRVIATTYGTYCRGCGEAVTAPARTASSTSGDEDVRDEGSFHPVDGSDDYNGDLCDCLTPEVHRPALCQLCGTTLLTHGYPIPCKREEGHDGDHHFDLTPPLPGHPLYVERQEP